MKFNKNLLFLIILILIPIGISPAEAELIQQTIDAGMDIQIEYAQGGILGRIFSVSILVQNNGWEDKQNVTFVLNSKDNSIIPISENKIFIEKLVAGGSYGETIDFEVSQDASVGTHFLNVEYSHILLQNNEEPQEPTFTNIAIPIIIKEQPKISIHTTTPESIFTNADFPFVVEIIPEDADITEVNIQIIPPNDIKFRGETMHTFSSIQKEYPVSITSRIITPEEEIETEFKVPFQIIVSYKNDIGEEKSDSKTISMLLRPRTFMELTTEGGIWIGNFFIAPYVSLGTIIGIPAGAIISILVRRSQNPKKRKKSKK